MEFMIQVVRKIMKTHNNHDIIQIIWDWPFTKIHQPGPADFEDGISFSKGDLAASPVEGSVAFGRQKKNVETNGNSWALVFEVETRQSPNGHLYHWCYLVTTSVPEKKQLV